MNTNLYNLNQHARTQSSLWSGFTPTDVIVWSSISHGTPSVYGNAPANAWGVVENTVAQLALTTTSYDMYYSFTGLATGLNLVVKVWVRLGAIGMNFNLTANNAASWNSMTG